MSRPSFQKEELVFVRRLQQIDLFMKNEENEMNAETMKQANGILTEPRNRPARSGAPP
jgi:hypothetical protein